MYARPSYKPMKTKPNEDVDLNRLEQNFNIGELMYVFVSDFTSISVGIHKDAALVQLDFATTKHLLETVKIFHTDRGTEFQYAEINEVLGQHNIECSISNKGNPYDILVSETTFKILKTELINAINF